MLMLLELQLRKAKTLTGAVYGGPCSSLRISEQVLDLLFCLSPLQIRQHSVCLDQMRCSS